MLGAASSEWEADPLREWADDCSVAALELHNRFDAGSGADEPAAAEVVDVLQALPRGRARL